MIRDIEITCRELWLPHCEAGEDSVGTRVEADHLAPALFGAQIEISVTAVEVEGRSVTFEASVQIDCKTSCRSRQAECAAGCTTKDHPMECQTRCAEISSDCINRCP
jgi:acyl-CoA thioesterase FadM